MSYHYQDGDGWLHASPTSREDEAGDMPPACASCRKSAHCPTFLPTVQSYLDTVADWRDNEGDPVACDASEDEGVIATRIRVLGYQWRGTNADKAAIATEMAALRRLLASRRQAGRRTVRGKSRDARGRWVVGGAK